MKRHNYDIFRRSEAARQSNKRAQARLARRLNDAGGLDDEMRYHMAQMKREQMMLKRELQGLKLEYSKISSEVDKSNGVIHLHEPQFDSEDERSDKHTTKTDSSVTLPSAHGYGRNYFGYQSSPGSNKNHDKSVRELEKSLSIFYANDNSDPVGDRKRKKKLKQQKKQNKQIQEKVDTWASNNKPRRKFSISVQPDLLHMEFLRQEFSENQHQQQNSPEPQQNNSVPSNRSDVMPPHSNVVRLPEVVTSRNKQDDVIDAGYELVKEEENTEKKVGIVKPASTNKAEVDGKKVLKVLNAEDLVFDANMYAPDGRLRMVHRLPDPTRAYDEARRARYVRTKHKREFERQLSVSQVFK